MINYVTLGYFQVSGRHRMIARLPLGMTGIEACKAQGKDFFNPNWDESSATDQYLRCFAKDTLTLSYEEWKQFKLQGGKTRR
jgi:hypothetical protein